MSFDTHPNYQEIIQASGYLFINPTDLSSEAGWGTKLGFVEGGVAWEPGHGVIELTEPETGDEPRYAIYTGNSLKFAAVLQNYNSTVLSVLFPGLVSSGNVNFPGDFKTGQDILDSGNGNIRLLYVPDDRVNHPVFLLQKAAPYISGTAKVKLSHSDRMLFPCIFTGARKTDDVDGIFYVGPLSGAVLR